MQALEKKPKSKLLGFNWVYFLFGRLVKAEPATVLTALLDLGSRSIFDANEPTFLLVTSLFLAMVNLRIRKNCRLD